MTQSIEIGRVLRANTSEFVVGCRVSQLEAPAFGALVRADAADDYAVFGLLYDVRIEDDGLVRQLVTAENVSPEVIHDNRERRIVPVEMSAVVVGYKQAGSLRHQLPPRPPLSLDLVRACQREEIRHFTASARFGYFRHILRLVDLPLAELLAAHVSQARAAQPDASTWTQAAVDQLIVLLRDDYPLLTSVLAALDQVVTPN